jgi:hypothetical protein
VYSTVQGYFYAWSRGGIFASLNYTLVMASREAAGREASPAKENCRVTTRSKTSPRLWMLFIEKSGKFRPKNPACHLYYVTTGCPYRISDPGILMMQSA